MKISLNKKYETSVNDKVRIICINRKSIKPIIALINRDNETELIVEYYENGKYLTESKHYYDLKEVLQDEKD